MPSASTLAVVAIVAVVVGGVIYALRRYMFDKIIDVAGRVANERAVRAEKELGIVKKQSEVMVEQKDVEDVAKSLDRGEF
jgi:hypothetical protein